MGLLTGHSRNTTQTIIEPLGLTLVGWKLNRIVGNERKCQEALAAFRATSLTHTSLHEIIGKDSRRHDAQLIQALELPLLGERRTVGIGGKTINALIGLPEEVKTSVDQRDFHSEAIISSEHGLLPLIIATSASTNSTAKYGYTGTLLFEPTVQTLKMSPESIRVLSALPARFISYYYDKFGSFSDLAIDTKDFLYDTPIKIEKTITQAAIIGSANLRERYQILALIGSNNVFQYVSRNIVDEQLPSQINQV